ncbi:MAG: hypothetical protein AAGA54_18155 [Myxococcota bacterium]
MDLEALEAVLRDRANDVDGEDGAWEFEIHGVHMACFTDTRFDRMRLVAPILEAAHMTDEQRAAVLEANFHTALDARYATSDGVLYSAFIHPLSPLSPEEFDSALRQVAGLVETFGTSYTSGALVFGVPGTGELN